MSKFAEYTQKDVIESLRKHWSEDDQPTQIEYELHEETPSISPVRVHFDSWRDAKKAAFETERDENSTGES